MKRTYLFLIGLVLPAIAQAQPGAADGFAGDNWTDAAAGGGRLFFALVAGVLLAFAIQWVLTCLSVATGATASGTATRRLRRRSYSADDRWREEYRDRDRTRDREWDGDAEKSGYRENRAGYERRGEEEDESWEKPARKIQAGVGAWVLVTASISTFFAAWLAAEMIRFGGRAEAVILGLTVWSGFMFGMMWLEATLIGSLLGNLFGAFKSGLRTASAPLKAAAGAASGAVSGSAEEIAAKVREEFRSQGGGGGLKEKLKEYMDAMHPRTIEKGRLEREVDDLFDDPEIREAVRQGAKVDKRKFQEMAAGRGDLPPDEQRMLVEVLQDRWHQAADEARRENAWSPAMSGAGEESRETELQSADSPEIARTGPAARAPEIQKTYSAGPYAASGSASAYGRGTRVAGGAPDFSARFQAFKDFLRSSDKRELNPLRLEQEVESVVIHPEEGYANMERSVRDMKREEISQVLKGRRDITLEEADSIADLIDAARTRMLSRSEIREHRTQETSDKALARIRDYVYSLKRPDIDLEGFKGDIARMLEDPRSGLGSLKSRAAGMDKQSLIDAFAAKKGISRQEAEQMAEQAERALKTAEENARRIEEETRRRLETAKRSALEQAEATRKVAASAAWWLFAVAMATAAAAALGGLTGAAT